MASIAPQAFTNLIKARGWRLFGLLSSSAIWCNSGRAKAAVLPVPVWATPSKSRPSSSGGMDLS